MKTHIAIIGAGLAGSECAWALAHTYGLSVTLFEMKPHKTTPAQISPNVFCELVCSNSLKSKSLLNPAGILKQEMQALGSLVISTAYATEVPAGESLAVEREAFSEHITQALRTHPNIAVVSEAVASLDPLMEKYDAIVVATGPLTDEALAEDLRQKTKSESLYFYDAIAPIIDGDTIDRTIAFKANRASRGQAQLDALSEGNTGVESGDYLNLPLNKEEYFTFVQKVKEGPKLPHKEFEEPRYFNGCQPIEVLAESGPMTLSFGPMKPIGLTDPRTGRWPYAVVQLRHETQGDGAWNMVGFQTRLTWGAQKEIFRTLPGLEQAEFFRLGSMHRNTYLVSPELLNADTFALKTYPKVYLAGQIMGVEGYLESAAMGLWVGHLLGRKFTKNIRLPNPPSNTSLGALVHYCLHTPAKNYVPMNIHWGLFDALENTPRAKLGKQEKRTLLAERAQGLFREWLPN